MVMLVYQRVLVFSPKTKPFLTLLLADQSVVSPLHKDIKYTHSYDCVVFNFHFSTPI